MADIIASPVARSPTKLTPTEVRVDMSNMIGSIGRIKEAPVCHDATLRKQAMSSEELSKFCFVFDTPKGTSLDDLPEPSVVSSSSSTASRDSNISDLDGHRSTPLRLERRTSEHIARVTSMKISRNGRATQRWHTDPNTQVVYRMITGCVPIVGDGKILFVSASRKAEWILPKGGWERDEDMGESAIRECFEEAGVVGILGPKLSEIEYETRKAKKRRIEFDELQRKAKMARDGPCLSPFGGKDDIKDYVQEDAGVKVHLENVAAVKESSLGALTDAASRIREHASKASDETSSVASDTSSAYTHARMILYPMYVSEVKSAWPESGRLRKVVDIDEAIKMCENRPELKQALLEVKEKNLHLRPIQGPDRVVDR